MVMSARPVFDVPSNYQLGYDHGFSGLPASAPAQDAHRYACGHARGCVDRRMVLKGFGPLRTDAHAAYRASHERPAL
jgi:hypothetical protein